VVTRTVPFSVDPADAGDRSDPALLAELVGATLDDGAPHEGSRIVGVEPAGDELRLHVAPVPADDRAGAAGLFGMRAAPEWTAVAEVFTGRARHLDDGARLGEATGVIVVDRAARVASQLLVDGRVVVAPGEHGPDGRSRDVPVGLVVDALHRMLGLASPGAAPAPPVAALAVWGQVLVQHTLEHGPPDWATAVALHPGDPGPSHVVASVETVTEATLHTGADMDWRRLHRRAVRRGDGHADLRPDEVTWMDATLYARWVIGSMPDPATVAELLEQHGAEDTARRVLRVAATVLDRLGAPARSSPAPT
jgi:hypothetical protein